jgi:hypothetical protein
LLARRHYIKGNAPAQIFRSRWNPAKPYVNLVDDSLYFRNFFSPTFPA